MKFCKDCKHCIDFETRPSFARCAISTRLKISPVSGEMEGGFCNIERGENSGALGGCGTEGIYFEPKTEKAAA